MSVARRAVFAVIALCHAAGHANEAHRLRACLDQAHTDPAAGYETALEWLSQGGRPAARHCAAMALSGLGHHDEAAARLESLAGATDAGSIADRAQYLALAGNLWMLAGRPAAAETALTSALKLVRGDSRLLTDRARARLLQKKWGAAIVDLDSVLSHDESDAVALQLRAEAWTRRGDLRKALADVERALAQHPKHIDLLVLQGNIRQKIRAGASEAGAR